MIRIRNKQRLQVVFLFVYSERMGMTIYRNRPKEISRITSLLMASEHFANEAECQQSFTPNISFSCSSYRRILQHGEYWVCNRPFHTKACSLLLNCIKNHKHSPTKKTASYFRLHRPVHHIYGQFLQNVIKQHIK